MKNGIGPQSLGASGISPNSKPCGTPLDFNAGLRAAEKAGKLPESFAKEVRADSPNNSGSPLYFQDDISKIQEAASTLEAHNIGGGGGAVQGAASMAQETAASQMGQTRQTQNRRAVDFLRQGRGRGGIKGLLAAARGIR